MDRVSHLLVVSRGRNPTFDYYLRPRLEAGAIPWSLAEAEGGAHQLERLLRSHPRGLFVIICRYLDAAWLAALQVNRSLLAGLAVFDDDDIPAALADEELPLAYRQRLWRLRGVWEEPLNQLQPQRWVSTQVLAESRVGGEVKRLAPLPLPDDARAQLCRRRRFRYAYHATASHAAEVRWLRPIVAEVQRAKPDWTFELMGDPTAAQDFRELPRVRLRQPRSWPRYLRRARRRPLHLGLVPFDDRPVNRARAEVKLFDYARQGAVALADARCPWRKTLEVDDAVLWVDPEPEAWIERIRTLRTEDLERTWAAMTRWLATRYAAFDPLPVS